MGLLLICEISVVGHRVRTTEEDRHRPGLATATDLAPGATLHVSIEGVLGLQLLVSGEYSLFGSPFIFEFTTNLLPLAIGIL